MPGVRPRARGPRRAPSSEARPPRANAGTALPLGARSAHNGDRAPAPAHSDEGLAPRPEPQPGRDVVGWPPGPCPGMSTSSHTLRPDSRRAGRFLHDPGHIESKWPELRPHEGRDGADTGHIEVIPGRASHLAHSGPSLAQESWSAWGRAGVGVGRLGLVSIWDPGFIWGRFCCRLAVDLGGEWGSSRGRFGSIRVDLGATRGRSGIGVGAERGRPGVDPGWLGWAEHWKLAAPSSPSSVP